MSRWLSWLSELQPEMFCEVSPQVAAKAGLENGGWATISTARAQIEARVLVTDRIKPLKMGKRTFHAIGLPYHWGRNGLARGDSANELLGLAADPNVSIMNSKAHTANIEPGRKKKEVVFEGPRLPGNELRDLRIVGDHRPMGKHLVSTSEDKQGDQT